MSVSIRNKNKVIDMSIHRLEDGTYKLYIPIETGQLSLRVDDKLEINDLIDFLKGALNIKSRRFGENPNGT